MSTDLDDTTRARLDDYLTAAWPPTRGTQEVVHRDDLTALLAAYDAQAARLETLEAVMQSDATLNRLQADNAQLRRVNLDLVHRGDQDAPVLAAVERLVYGGGHHFLRYYEFVNVVDAWRAGREG